MAGNIYTWSTTAATNASADADINFAEGQAPGTVNDSARGAMAAGAGILKDTNATLATAGGPTAYTVTSNIAIAALATGLKLRLKANATNTGASTLNLTPAGGAAFGAKAIRVAASSGGTDTDVAAGNIQNNGIYEFNYDAAANAAAGAWILLNPTFAGQLPFPATQNASTNANTLDDYVEGTFTPGFSFGGASVGIVYTAQQGLYTKIGRLVTFTARVTISSKGSSTGNFLMTGLPFTSAATYSTALSTWYGFMTFTTAGGETWPAIIPPSSTTIQFWENFQGTGPTVQQMTNAWVLNNTDIIVSGHYTV